MSHMLRSAGYGRRTCILTILNGHGVSKVNRASRAELVASLARTMEKGVKEVRGEECRRGRTGERRVRGKGWGGLTGEEGWRVRREPAEPAFYNISNKQFMTSPCSQAQSCRPHQASPGPAMHTQARRGLTRPNKAQSDPARSNQAQSGPYKTNQAQPDPTRPNQARPGLTIPVQA